jgi:hypothetical protein
MNREDVKTLGRKQGAYNAGSLTGYFDALEEGDWLLFAHDEKTTAACRNAAKRIEANNEERRISVMVLNVFDSALMPHSKVIKVQRLQ